MKILMENWYDRIIGSFLMAVFACYIRAGENSYMGYTYSEISAMYSQILRNVRMLWKESTLSHFFYEIILCASAFENSFYTFLYRIFLAFTEIHVCMSVLKLKDVRNMKSVKIIQLSRNGV
jgi:hypothetical protein